MKTSNAEHDRQRRTLMIVLILNGLLFVGLGLGGLLANSSALLANALDNASDSLVYLISFLAVGRALAWKLRAARTFSFNDFASNGGILVAGALVLWLKQSWPDLVVGVIVAGIAAKGGLEILEGARKINIQRASDGASRGG